MTMTRDDVLRRFDEDQALTAASYALSVQYAHTTQAARVRLGAEPYWSFISQDERDKAAQSGAAMPDGSYPIFACEGDNSVDSAIHAVGMGGADHDAIRAHIIKRADTLDCASKIPDNWNRDGSLKASAEPVAAAAPPAPPAAPEAKPTDPPKPDAGEGSPADAEVDAGMDVLVGNLNDTIAKLKAQQSRDPGNDTGLDAEIVAKLDQLEAIGTDLAKTQKADSAENAAAPAKPDDAAPAPDAPAPADGADDAPAMSALASETPGNAEGVPNDGDDNGPGPGEIEASVACQNPDCGHTAGVHADDADLGNNSGACTTPGCTCPGMIPDGQQVNSPADSGDGANDGQSNANTSSDTNGSQAVGAPGTAGGPIGGGPTGKGHATAGQAFAPGDTPAPAPEAAPAAPGEPVQAPAMDGAPAAPEQLPPLNPDPQAGEVGPMWTMPVAWLEGSPTGDGRMIDAPGEMGAGLSWRTPPLALMGMKTSVHDPSGMSGNDPAVLVGRIESIERKGNVGWAQGHFLATDDGMEFADIVRQMGRMGVSIDVGSAQVQITADPTVEPTGDVFDLPVMEHLTEGEVMGITICPFAAFPGAYIVLGDGSDVPDAEVPAAPEGASMSAIHYVGEQPCIPCNAAPGEAIVASGADAAPSRLRPPRAWFDNPGFTAGDGRLRETLDSRTGKPSGKFACPVTVTEDGQVFGHIAQWGVCHQSPAFLNGGTCVLAPRSRTDYAAFHGTGDVLTAEGELIGVGRMTADTGHAPVTKDYSYAQAVAHYDNSGLTTALVRAGEDEFGIWVAGTLHPSATDEQVFTMRANPPSGDWRPFAGSRELCSVLFVNHPGFPMVKAAQDKSTGQFTSLVAAGVPLFTMPEIEATPRTIEERLAAMEAAAGPVYDLAREHLRTRRAAIG